MYTEKDPAESFSHFFPSRMQKQLQLVTLHIFIFSRKKNHILCARKQALRFTCLWKGGQALLYLLTASKHILARHECFNELVYGVFWLVPLFVAVQVHNYRHHLWILIDVPNLVFTEYQNYAALDHQGRS